jgi:hypothetical protein
MAHFRRFPGLTFRLDPREPNPPHFIHLHEKKHIPHPSNYPGHTQTQNLNAFYIQHENVWNDAASESLDASAGGTTEPPLAKNSRKGKLLLPPSSTKVSAQIIQDTATVTVTHSFENSSEFHIEQANYQFPLPHTAAVVDFTCRIGDSVVLRGTVKAKEQAKREFHDAVKLHRPAGLLEQDKSPEIFRMSIGNIPAGAKATTELTIILLLKHDFLPAKSVTQTTLAIPTYIAPRYGIPPTEITPRPPRPETAFSVDIDTLSAEDIIEIRSNTHSIRTQRGAAPRKCQRWADLLAPQTGPSNSESTSAHIKLSSPITHLDQDFTLTITTRPDAGVESPIACLEMHPSLPNHAALMVTLPPKFMLQRSTPLTKSASELPNYDSEIIFLADRSGSMRDKMAGLRSAMEFFIRGIPEGRPFNIWCFGSAYTSLWTKSRIFGQDTMTEALRYVELGFNANMGGTELLPALQAAIAARDVERAIDVVVLTDGEVWQLDETISFVEKSRGEGSKPVRYFGLGIGSAVSRALVEGIASAGGGYAEIIPHASAGDWEDRLVAVLEAALTGHCGRVSVEVDGLLQTPAVLTSPRNISAISPFMRSRIFYLFEGVMTESCKTVIVKTTDVDGNEVRKVIPVLTLRDKDLKLHKFAARAILEDLERRHNEIQSIEQKRSGYYYAQSTTSQEMIMVRQEGERLGCKWSLASNWTSFVALEERVDENPRETASEVVTMTPNDELGLLRPRNHPAKQRLLVAAALSATGNAVTDSGQGTRLAIENGFDHSGADSDDTDSDTQDSMGDARSISNARPLIRGRPQGLVQSLRPSPGLNPGLAMAPARHELLSLPPRRRGRPPKAETLARWSGQVPAQRAVGTMCGQPQGQPHGHQAAPRLAEADSQAQTQTLGDVTEAYALDYQAQAQAQALAQAQLRARLLAQAQRQTQLHQQAQIVAQAQTQQHQQQHQQHQNAQQTQNTWIEQLQRQQQQHQQQQKAQQAQNAGVEQIMQRQAAQAQAQAQAQALAQQQQLQAAQAQTQTQTQAQAKTKAQAQLQALNQSLAQLEAQNVVRTRALAQARAQHAQARAPTPSFQNHTKQLGKLTRFLSPP